MSRFRAEKVEEKQRDVLDRQRAEAEGADRKEAGLASREWSHHPDTVLGCGGPVRTEGTKSHKRLLPFSEELTV